MASKTKKKRSRSDRRRRSNAVTAFNSTVLTLVGAYATTGSVIMTCGAGLVAIVLVMLLLK